MLLMASGALISAFITICASIAIHCCLERAVTVPKKNAYVPAPGVRHGDVQLAVSIEVSDSDSLRGHSDWIAYRPREIDSERTHRLAE